MKKDSTKVKIAGEWVSVDDIIETPKSFNDAEIKRKIGRPFLCRYVGNLGIKLHMVCNPEARCGNCPYYAGEECIFNPPIDAYGNFPIICSSGVCGHHPDFWMEATDEDI